VLAWYRTQAPKKTLLKRFKLILGVVLSDLVYLRMMLMFSHVQDFALLLQVLSTLKRNSSPTILFRILRRKITWNVGVKASKLAMNLAKDTMQRKIFI